MQTSNLRSALFLTTTGAPDGVRPVMCVALREVGAAGVAVVRSVDCADADPDDEAKPKICLRLWFVSSATLCFLPSAKIANGDPISPDVNSQSTENSFASPSWDLHTFRASPSQPKNHVSSLSDSSSGTSVSESSSSPSTGGGGAASFGSARAGTTSASQAG
eukprot:13040563-Alexandrium_andersonii.AAC.1